MINNSTCKKVDLHLHSNASDGIYAPSELIKLASDRGLSAVALTDHETTNGVAEAQDTGKRKGVEVIAGVEISSGFHKRELHILGYFTEKSARLEGILRELRVGRFQRMEAMIAGLKELSIEVSREDIKKEAGNAAPGRLHMARILHKKGYVRDIKEAFDCYLGRDKPAYIPRTKLKAEEAIKLLIECGAVPVLAHPGTTNEDSSSVRQLKQAGLSGIEAFHTEHTAGLSLFYKNLAAREGLLVTGGSDFHGDDNMSCPYPGYIKIDYDYLELLKKSMNR